MSSLTRTVPLARETGVPLKCGLKQNAGEVAGYLDRDSCRVQILIMRELRYTFCFRMY